MLQNTTCVKAIKPPKCAITPSMEGARNTWGLCVRGDAVKILGEPPYLSPLFSRDIGYEGVIRQAVMNVYWAANWWIHCNVSCQYPIGHDV